MFADPGHRSVSNRQAQARPSAADTGRSAAADPAVALGIVSISDDAADRRARTALIAELQLFQDLSAETVEQMPLGFVALDIELRVSYANPIALGLVGLSLDELVGRRPWDLFPQVVGTHHRTVRATAPVAIEYEARLGPQERWVGVLACPTRAGTAVFLRDITEKKGAEETVRRLVALLHGSLDAMLDAFLVCSAVRDQKGGIAGFNVDFANTVAGKSMGLAPDTLIGAPVPDWLPDLLGISFVDACREVVETGEPCIADSVPFVVPRPEGTTTYGTLSIQVLRFNDGFFATWRDVTERELVRREREFLSAVLEQVVDGVVIIDPSGTVTYANPAFRGVAGLAVADIVGHPAADVARELFGPLGFEPREQSVLKREPRLEAIERIDADGTAHHLEASMTPVRDGGGNVTSYVVLTRDVTQLREAVDELAQEVRTRTALAESIHRLPVQASLDQAAQAICDELVKLPFVGAAAVEAFLGPMDVQVIARTAPPQFPVLADSHLPPDRAAFVRERAALGAWAEYEGVDSAAHWLGPSPSGLKATAHGPINHGDHVAGVLVIGTFDEGFAHTLVERMPGIVLFSTASSALLAERLHDRSREAELRDSLSAVIATRAFHPVFQPIVDLESDEVVGYEALTRFDTGQRPDVCFAEAWSVGLGAELELATVRAALADARALAPGLWLDLNVSPRLLRRPGRLKSMLGSADRPIVLEITEHEVIDDYDALREAIRTLGRDIRVAVDDAGAGVANFSHIIDMRPDFVKLDMSLVRRVNRNLGRQAMVVGMRHFSRTAGCRLVAEGIESVEEAHTLKGLGVEFGQGYLFGRGMPIGELPPAQTASGQKVFQRTDARA